MFSSRFTTLSEIIDRHWKRLSVMLAFSGETALIAPKMFNSSVEK